MPPRTINIQKTAEYSPQVRIDFIEGVDPFEAAVENKSYPLIWEKAMKCPCRTQNNMDSSPHNCQNCFGYGSFYIDPTRVMGMAYDINNKNSFYDWSIDNTGIVKFSISANARPTVWDRITVENATSINTETTTTMDDGCGNQFIYTIYQPLVVTDVRIYESLTEPLRKVSPSDIEIGDYHITIKNIPYSVGISVRYEHKPQYIVIDLPHEIRNISTMKNGIVENPQYPVSVIAKKAHYLFDAPDVAGREINNNDSN